MFQQIPLAVWRLMIAYALMMAGTSMMVLIAGIIGTAIAPTAGLATLPIATTVVGVAASTLPTGRLLSRFGRRRVFIGYGVLAIGSALLAALSLVMVSFALFCGAAFLMGWSAAGGHQYRFAALESVPAEVAPKATSVLLLGGILSAFIGPELAIAGRHLLDAEFAGSYLMLGGSYLVGLLVISFHADSQVSTSHDHGSGRPLSVIMRTRGMVLAIGAAAVGYGVMSFIMTATPISMNLHAGHSLESTKFVIQSHIAAMYLPSLAYGSLCARFGFRVMMWAGVSALLLCLLVALIDTSFLHYWLALVLLGLGWNFLFLSGTNLLPYGYRPEERFRVQAANDFVVFTVQALVSLSSGWFLFQWQWHGLLWTCIPMVALFVWWLLRTNIPAYTGQAQAA